MRRRYPPCQAAGPPLAALPAQLPAVLPAQLPAVLPVAAHDSRLASYPTNVACNSPNTAPHHATISLELQRLRTLLKVHPIELHAKLLQARAACVPRRARGLDTSRVGPMARAWARHFARGGLMVCVGAAPRRISRGWRACRGVNAHCQRFMCERCTRSGAVVPTTQTTSPATPRCLRLLSRWFVLWAAPPRGAPSPTVNCGDLRCTGTGV